MTLASDGLLAAQYFGMTGRVLDRPVQPDGFAAGRAPYLDENLIGAETLAAGTKYRALLQRANKLGERRSHLLGWGEAGQRDEEASRADREESVRIALESGSDPVPVTTARDELARERREIDDAVATTALLLEAAKQEIVAAAQARAEEAQVKSAVTKSRTAAIKAMDAALAAVEKFVVTEHTYEWLRGPGQAPRRRDVLTDAGGYSFANRATLCAALTQLRDTLVDSAAEVVK